VDLLPDLDRMSDSYRLIYYDQRGRRASARGVKPEDVTMQSDVEDLEGVRKHFRLDSVALLGHSFGAVLAMEYAIRHPDHVSFLILMNPAPASHAVYLLLRVLNRFAEWSTIFSMPDRRGGERGIRAYAAAGWPTTYRRAGTWCDVRTRATSPRGDLDAATAVFDIDVPSEELARCG